MAARFVQYDLLFTRFGIDLSITFMILGTLLPDFVQLNLSACSNKQKKQ
jgi:hypothetical protein